MKTILIVLAIALTSSTWCQDPASPVTYPKDVTIGQDTGSVTITAKGLDVRSVLFDLFTQGKKNFVLEPNVHFALYLALTGVQFDEALEIVCHTAELKFEISNGIYYVSKSKKEEPVKPEAAATPKLQGKLTDSELMKKVTTKLSKADIRTVFAAFERQSGIEITVDKSVPAYKVDAFLVGTSLKYALDVVTRAAGLECVRTENKTLSIQVKNKS